MQGSCFSRERTKRKQYFWKAGQSSTTFYEPKITTVQGQVSLKRSTHYARVWPCVMLRPYNLQPSFCHNNKNLALQRTTPIAFITIHFYFNLKYYYIFTSSHVLFPFVLNLWCDHVTIMWRVRASHMMRQALPFAPFLLFLSLALGRYFSRKLSWRELIAPRRFLQNKMADMRICPTLHLELRN